MKKIFRNSTHINGKSYDCLVIDLNGKKIKMTYRSINATESCSIEMFDGCKFNHLFSMLDMGVMPEDSYYINAINVREKRADDLFKIGEKLCTSLL